MTKPASARSLRNKAKKLRLDEQVEGDPLIAGSDSQHDSSQFTGLLSPPQPEQLPAHQVNNISATNVSVSLSPNLSKASTNESQPEDGGGKINNGGTSNSIQSNNNHELPLPTDSSSNITMGDNRSSENGSASVCKCGAPKEDYGASIKLVLSELQEIKSQMSKIVKIEASTESLANQVVGIANRTAEIDTAVKSKTARLREVDDEIATIKTFVGKQENTINSFRKLKEECQASTSKSVAQMNALVGEQQTQVETFKSSVKIIKKDILVEVDKSCNTLFQENFLGEVDERIKREIKSYADKVTKDNHCSSIKKQAYDNRLNLVIMGLAEEEQKGTVEVVKDFISNTLKVTGAEVIDADRLGPQPEDGIQYNRPILVKFRKFYQRNAVWKKRTVLSGEDNSSRIRVQADLPKPLREGLKSMHRVVRAAASFDEYKNAKVKDHQLEINNEVYQFHELETLPFPLRPSTLASPRSDEALAFFTSASILSNHHPSTFTIGEETFHSVEQFLAFRKAELSGKDMWIDKASKSQDPVQAKFILHQLKNDHVEEWDQRVEEIAMEGLRAKFQQNKTMGEFLCSTNNLLLGEASKNPRWGTGFELSDENVLDHTKWSPTGNLLGRTLMKVRSELREL